MSDPVTNVQIEDVLSSIRKLVSEEIRSQTRDAVAANPKEAEATPPASGGRLILTPALRVDTGADGAGAGDEAGFMHAEPDDVPGDGEADLLNLMERVRAAGAQVSRSEQKPLKGIKSLKPVEPKDDTTPEMAIESALAALAAGDGADEDAGEDPVGTSGVDAAADGTADVIEDTGFDDDLDTDHSDDALVAGKVDDGDDAPFASSDDASDDTILPTFLRHRGAETLQKRVADVESVIRDQGGDWEPEADEETDAAPGPQSESLPWDDEDEATEDADAADADWTVDPVENADKAAMEDAARSHLRVASSTTDWSDDWSEEGPEQNTDQSVEDIAQAFADAQDDTQADPDDWEDAAYGDDIVSAEDHKALAADEPSVIDEEVLRDMVAEIVRQELQGALGERITRNVRKLVRREIHRALSAHEID